MSRALVACALVFGALHSPTDAAEPVARIVIQNSPLAGARYYDANSVWAEMRAGDALELVREPDNPHDANAIRIEWRGRKIGYVPRRENEHLARQMDHGARPQATVTGRTRFRNGRKGVSYEIFVPLAVARQSAKEGQQ
jgi:hypothetical protein